MKVEQILSAGLLHGNKAVEQPCCFAARSRTSGLNGSASALSPPRLDFPSSLNKHLESPPPGPGSVWSRAEARERKLEQCGLRAQN